MYMNLAITWSWPTVPQSRISAVFLVIQLLFYPSLVHADDDKYGALDFTRMPKAAEKRFWWELFLLAHDEAVADLCGQPFDFEHKAMAAIKTCVTADALRRADSFFKVSKRYCWAIFAQEKWVCHGPYDHGSMHYKDTAEETDYARKQMSSDLTKITELCQKCKTSVWAPFCR
jgi:hypothetical protein